MTAKKNTFQGKDIAEAISDACKRLKVPQEQLDIEVVNTGSAGIFGLCRQKAAIKVTLKKEAATEEAGATLPPAAKKKAAAKKETDRPGCQTQTREERLGTSRAGGCPTGTAGQGRGEKTGRSRPENSYR